MHDDDLDKLLSFASTPKISAGFEQRLIAKIAPANNVPNTAIAFPKRKTASPWLIGLPLAASLVLGVWLGASNTSLNPANIMVSQTTDDTTSNGFDDVVALIEGNLS